MPTNELLRTCLDHLKDLPFIVDAEFTTEVDTTPKRRPFPPDALFTIRLRDGTQRRAVAEIKRTNLTTALVTGIREQLNDYPEHLPFVIAPYVPPGIGDVLVGMALNYVDVAGNRHVNIDDRYVALIGGRKLRRTAEDHGFRAAAYQVIFVLLTHGQRVDATMRDLAADANVALGTVKNTIDQLQEAGAIARANKGYVIRDREKLLARWVHGYETVVRPRWLAGRFTTQTREPAAFDALVQDAMADQRQVEWAWGGGMAAYVLTKYYRGPEIVLHTTGRLREVQRALRALPDERGNLLLLRTPAGPFLHGEAPHTAHPLLVYAELRTKHDERADEAADLIKTEFIDA